MKLGIEQSELVALGQALRRAGYSFTTVTPETHQRVLARAERRGDAEAHSLRDVFGWNKHFDAALLPAEMFSHLSRAAALESAGGRFRSGVRFSTLGDRLLVHSAFPTSSEGAVFFGPDTYRFAALLRRWAPPAARRIVDIGCGTGAGGILLADRQPERLVLADVNPIALDYASVNLTLAGMTAEVVHSDILKSVSGPFDLIIANPPYLKDESERTYRHGGGDYGEALGVRIVREAVPRLAPGGVLILYTGAAFVNGEDTFALSVKPALEGFSRANVTYEELDPDVFGEELELPNYAEVERIAAVGLRVCVS